MVPSNDDFNNGESDSKGKFGSPPREEILLPKKTTTPERVTKLSPNTVTADHETKELQQSLGFIRSSSDKIKGLISRNVIRFSRLDNLIVVDSVKNQPRKALNRKLDFGPDEKEPSREISYMQTSASAVGESDDSYLSFPRKKDRAFPAFSIDEEEQYSKNSFSGNTSPQGIQDFMARISPQNVTRNRTLTSEVVNEDDKIEAVSNLAKDGKVFYVALELVASSNNDSFELVRLTKEFYEKEFQSDIHKNPSAAIKEEWQPTKHLEELKLFFERLVSLIKKLDEIRYSESGKAEIEKIIDEECLDYLSWFNNSLICSSISAKSKISHLDTEIQITPKKSVESASNQKPIEQIIENEIISGIRKHATESSKEKSKKTKFEVEDSAINLHVGQSIKELAKVVQNLHLLGLLMNMIDSEYENKFVYSVGFTKDNFGLFYSFGEGSNLIPRFSEIQEVVSLKTNEKQNQYLELLTNLLGKIDVEVSNPSLNSAEKVRSLESILMTKLESYAVKSEHEDNFRKICEVLRDNIDNPNKGTYAILKLEKKKQQGTESIPKVTEEERNFHGSFFKEIIDERYLEENRYLKTVVNHEEIRVNFYLRTDRRIPSRLSKEYDHVTAYSILLESFVKSLPNFFRGKNIDQFLERGFANILDVKNDEDLGQNLAKASREVSEIREELEKISAIRNKMVPARLVEDEDYKKSVEFLDAIMVKKISEQVNVLGMGFLVDLNSELGASFPQNSRTKNESEGVTIISTASEFFALTDQERVLALLIETPGIPQEDSAKFSAFYARVKEKKHELIKKTEKIDSLAILRKIANGENYNENDLNIFIKKLSDSIDRVFDLDYKSMHSWIYHDEIKPKNTEEENLLKKDKLFKTMDSDSNQNEYLWLLRLTSRHFRIIGSILSQMPISEGNIEVIVNNFWNSFIERDAVLNPKKDTTESLLPIQEKSDESEISNFKDLIERFPEIDLVSELKRGLIKVFAESQSAMNFVPYIIEQVKDKYSVDLPSEIYPNKSNNFTTPTNDPHTNSNSVSTLVNNGKVQQHSA